MGLFSNIKRWLSMPLHPTADTFSLVIFVGILIVVIWLWNSVILAIKRIGTEV